MRTDQILARNVDELSALQRGRRLRRAGWICLAVVLLGIGGAVGYLAYFSDARRALAEKVGRWVQRKGRALMGKTWLVPFLAVLDRSDLTADEKAQWRGFVDATWGFAEKVGGDVLRREDVIDLGRKVVESRSGLYYGLLRIADVKFGETGVDPVKKEEEARLLQHAADILRVGRYDDAQLGAVRGIMHLALLEVCAPTDGADGGGKGKEAKPGAQESHVQQLLGALRGLERGGESMGDTKPMDMAEEFRKDMEGFRAGIETVKKGAGNRKQAEASTNLATKPEDREPQ